MGELQFILIFGAVLLYLGVAAGLTAWLRQRWGSALAWLGLIALWGVTAAIWSWQQADVPDDYGHASFGQPALLGWLVIVGIVSHEAARKKADLPVQIGVAALVGFFAVLSGYAVFLLAPLGLLGWAVVGTVRVLRPHRTPDRVPLFPRRRP
jgi:hypothetical protein